MGPSVPDTRLGVQRICGRDNGQYSLGGLISLRPPPRQSPTPQVPFHNPERQASSRMHTIPSALGDLKPHLASQEQPCCLQAAPSSQGSWALLTPASSKAQTYLLCRAVWLRGTQPSPFLCLCWAKLSHSSSPPGWHFPCGFCGRSHSSLAEMVCASRAWPPGSAGCSLGGEEVLSEGPHRLPGKPESSLQKAKLQECLEVPCPPPTGPHSLFCQCLCRLVTTWMFPGLLSKHSQEDRPTRPLSWHSHWQRNVASLPAPNPLPSLE